MNILLDTCIIIDALQDRHPFSSEARMLIDTAALGYYNAYVTAKELTDIHYIMKDHYQNEKQTRKTISGLLSVFKILDTTSIQVQIALYSEMPDYEDAIMVQAARQNNIDLIVTRNLKDYKNSPVPVCSPSDCLKKFDAEAWG